MHWPKISEKKRAELETLKLSLKTSPKRRMSPKSTMAGSVHDSISRNQNTRAASAHGGGEENSVMKRKIVWPDNPLKPKPVPKKEGKIVDWLRE